MASRGRRRGATWLRERGRRRGATWLRAHWRRRGATWLRARGRRGGATASCAREERRRREKSRWQLSARVYICTCGGGICQVAIDANLFCQTVGGHFFLFCQNYMDAKLKYQTLGDALRMPLSIAYLDSTDASGPSNCVDHAAKWVVGEMQRKERAESICL